MTVAPASIAPLFGRTQYLRGAVVFTLKHTFLSEGFFSLRLMVTTTVKGPDRHRKDKHLYIVEFTPLQRNYWTMTVLTNFTSIHHHDFKIKPPRYDLSVDKCKTIINIVFKTWMKILCI